MAVIDGDDGPNTLNDTSGDDQIAGRGGDDTITVTNGNDTVDGGSGADTLIIDWAAATSAVVRASSTSFTDNGTRTVSYVDIFQMQIFTGSGNDVVDVTSGNNYLNLGAGDDHAVGRFGNDIIDVGTGNDTAEGGSGNNDVIIADLSAATSAIVYNLFVDTYSGPIGSFHGFESLGGGPDDKFFLLGSGNDVIVTESAVFVRNDLVDLGGGDDTISIFNGADTIRGGAGTDTVIVDWSAATTAVISDVPGSDFHNGGTRRLDYESIERFNITTGSGNDDLETGSGNDIIKLGAGNDQASGLGGNDVIDGGPGDDVMVGGFGDDVYGVDSAGDVVTELAGEGRDKILSAISLTLADNVEDLTLQLNAGAASGTGNDLANVITGNDSANGLFGEGADDVLVGNGGEDTLDGGSGNDQLFGGQGNDTLDGATGADEATGGLGDDRYFVDGGGDRIIERNGEGRDRIDASVTFTLPSHVEDLTLQAAAGAIDGNGNDLANVIEGNDSANVLNGSGGADLLLGHGGNDQLKGGPGADDMRGGAGDDTYFVENPSDVAIELSGEGRDQVFSIVSYTLGANVEDLTLQTGASAATGTGNDLANALNGSESANALSGLGGNDSLFGNGNNDTLSGGLGDDLLDGGAGNDALDGGIGADDMTGGIGDDVYFADSAADEAIELAGQGRDKVYASASFTLGANIEDLTLQAGAAGSTGTGNDLANVLSGNGFNNVLRGLNGDDVLIGNAGNDTLQGGFGRDTMQGGADADTFWFTTALGAGNLDRIVDFQVGIDEIILENSVFSGLPTGPLAPGAFNTGSAATDADDRIIYNSATGALFFDSDGSGAAAAVQFATLQTGLALSASDFTVI